MRVLNIKCKVISGELIPKHDLAVEHSQLLIDIKSLTETRYHKFSNYWNYFDGIKNKLHVHPIVCNYRPVY